ncbi:MAG: SUMF1/EgtB/PvdO family nonheme iron enzyme [Rhodospirillales bacterium]|nr:SUMF1/EgtB/PvdO family nonheme iron enzyme [Rhodospirillales bacterium]
MADGENEEKPVSLFYSYSHRDEELRRKLEDHLAGLRWNGMITDWHDRNIDAGDEWAKEIDRNLTSADIILLLVSASFIASKYCWSIEVKKALERHDRGEAKVIPVILRPCSWHATPFAKLQAVPTDAKPVTSWSDPDEALYDAASRIERAVTDLQQQRRRAAGARHPPIRAEAIKDFAAFRDIDAPWCPVMVALPAGEFLMGSPEDEKERYKNEGPQHRVAIDRRFAMGRHPVTFDEYDHFCAATKREKPGDYGWGRGRRPVVDVSWQDARAYCAWLANETEQPYRLPSEAEWEYAARAGTTTRYAFGDAIAPKDANYGSNVGKTTEVGAYPPNAWGLYDIHGNVWDWVEDVYNNSYRGAPNDGSAWTDGEGENSSRGRVFRGGSWDFNPRFLRSANRIGNEPDFRIDYLGFRVARTLD